MTSPLPALVQATSGALGSACANSIAYPLDVTTTRIQTQKRTAKQTRKNSYLGSGLHDVWSLLRLIIRKRGVSGLYAGLGSDTASTLLSNFLYFYAYSFLRNSVQRRALARKSVTGHSGADAKTAAAVALSVYQELGIGYIAGVSSRLITTPLSVVTVRLQLDGEADDEDSLGVLETVRELYHEDGIKGFWKGFQSMIVLSANPAITLLFYQLFRRLLLHGKARDHPSSLQAFVLGGFSNSLAVAILYPLILLKTRLQSARRKSSTDLLSGDNKPRESNVSIYEVARGIVKAEGVTGLYQGLEAQLLKGIVTQGITLSAKQR